MRYIVSKKRICITLCLIVALALLFSALSAAALQKEVSENVLRLRVVAASDSAEDQAAKLAVRDAVLEYVSPLLAGCASAAEAEERLAAAMDGISLCAAEAAARLGQSGARAELVREDFPRKEYGSFSLPAGSYRALRVTLGSGEGHNWWCVVFPGLCIPAAADVEQALAAAGMSSYAIEAVTSEPDVRFWILDLLYGLRALLR